MGSMLELENEVAELKQKLLTHEITTSMILTNIVQILNVAKPGAIDALSKLYQEGHEKLPETVARNDPHAADAIKRIMKILEMAAKK